MPGKRGKKGSGVRSKARIGPSKKRRATQDCLEKKKVSRNVCVVCVVVMVLFCLLLSV